MSVGDNPVLTSVAQSLKPFIKTRQEALRVRRILSLYLASAIGGLSEDTISPLSLAVPGRDVYVKAIPPGISGIRKDYLLALRANAKARDSYEQTLRQMSLATENSPKVNQGEQEGCGALHVSTYLDLAQLQKQYEKLKIIQGYLDEFRKKVAASDDGFSVSPIRQDADSNDFTPPTVEKHIPTNASGIDNQSRTLITQLEKAVLRANDALERERRLLDKLKSKNRSIGKPGHAVQLTQATKTLALRKTRDELVSWIEQKLAKVNEAEDNPRAQSPLGSINSATAIEQHKGEIEKTYQRYLGVRRSIVDVLLTQHAVHDAGTQSRRESKNSDRSEKSVLRPTRDATMALPYITESMIPFANAQNALLQQEAHLSCSLNAHKRVLNRVLDRLADESHLLANYPMLSLQPRFKHAVAALGGSKLSPSPPKDTPETTEDVITARHAQAWAFAAEAARVATNKGLDERLRQGEQHAIAAESTLIEMQDMLGVDSDEGGDNSGADVWNPNQSPIGKGTWAGLDGNLGASTSP